MPILYSGGISWWRYLSLVSRSSIFPCCLFAGVEHNPAFTRVIFEGFSTRQESHSRLD